MPEMRMNSLKSRAMNCGPLSEIMRGFASGYFSCAEEDGCPVSRVRLHHVSSDCRAGKNGAHQLRSKAKVDAYGLHGCRETHEPTAVTMTAILLSCASSLACF
jgi:hypothetical protein